MFKNQSIINHLYNSSNLHVTRAIFMASGPSEGPTQIEAKEGEGLGGLLDTIGVIKQTDQKAFLKELAKQSDLISAATKEDKPRPIDATKPFYRVGDGLDIRINKDVAMPLDAIKQALNKVSNAQFAKLKLETEAALRLNQKTTQRAEAAEGKVGEVTQRAEAAEGKVGEVTQRAETAEKEASIATERIETTTAGLPFMTETEAWDQNLIIDKGEGDHKDLQPIEGYIFVTEKWNSNNFAVLKIVAGHEEDSTTEQYARALAAYQGKPYMSRAEAVRAGLYNDEGAIKPGYEAIGEGDTNYAARKMEVKTTVRSDNLENVVLARLDTAGNSTEKEAKAVTDAKAEKDRIKGIENGKVEAAQGEFDAAKDDVIRIEGEISKIKRDRKQIETDYQGAQTAFNNAEQAFNDAAQALVSGQIAERISSALKPFKEGDVTIDGLEIKGGKLYLKTKETLKIRVPKIHDTDAPIFKEENRLEIANIDDIKIEGIDTKNAIEQNSDQILAFVNNPDKNLQSTFDTAKSNKESAKETLDEKKDAFDKMNAEKKDSKTDPLNIKKEELKGAKRTMEGKRKILKKATSDREKALKAEDKKIEAAKESLQKKALDELLKLIADVCKERGIKIDWCAGSTFVVDGEGFKFKPGQKITSDVVTQNEGRDLVVGIENKQPILILTNNMLEKDSIKQLIKDSGITKLEDLERNRYENKLKQLIGE